MKYLICLLSLCFVSVANGQEIRKNEVDKLTGKRVKETSIEALDKGFIYRLRDLDGKYYMEVRLQKHGNFNVTPDDTLYLVGDQTIKLPCVRGAQATIPGRPKSPGVLSAWVLFAIERQDVEAMQRVMVTDARIGSPDNFIRFNEQLQFKGIKAKPAKTLQKAAQLITNA